MLNALVFLPGFAAGRPKAIATAATESSSASVAKSTVTARVVVKMCNIWGCPMGVPQNGWFLMVYNGKSY